MTERLVITDGTRVVNLIDQVSGFGLTAWNPSIVEPKTQVWQDSPLNRGRKPVMRHFGNAFENLTFTLRAASQDMAYRYLQDLRALLDAAVAYYEGWSDAPVWIEAQASCETNKRYAVLLDWRTSDEGNPFLSPFLQPEGGAVMQEFLLTIERSDWMSNAPGDSECTLVGNQEVFDISGWSTVYTAAGENFNIIKQVANGDIYAGTREGNLYKSTDGGDTWALNYAFPNGPAPIHGIVQNTSTGRIYVGYSENVPGTNDIWYSDDNGATWTGAASATFSFSNVEYDTLFITASGTLLIDVLGKVYRSTAAAFPVFTLVLTTTATSTYGFYTISQSSDGKIYCNSSGFEYFVSEDDGATWNRISNRTTPVPGTNPAVHCNLEIEDGVFLIGGYENSLKSVIRRSFDGTNWATLQQTDSGTSFPAYGVWHIFKDSADTIWAFNSASVSSIWRSDDGGNSFYREITLAAGDVITGMVAANGKVFAVCDTKVYRRDIVSVTSGILSTCADDLVISNKMSLAQITNILISDGGAFTSIYPGAALPVDLFPAVPAVNDALYIGSSTASVNAAPFNSVVFDLVGLIGVSYTIIPEYWNGAAWTTLTVTDETASFLKDGVGAITFTPPSNWAATAVNSITGYWIRFRVSAGTFTPPKQQNREVYSAVLPYGQIADTAVQGEIPALARIRIRNRSDLDGRAGSAPDLWANRIVVGLRSLDRGSAFVSHLNVSDTLQPAGVSCAAGTGAAFGAGLTGITGRLLTWSAVAGDTAFADRATFTITSAVARDFYGEYQMFLRAGVASGSANEITLRAQVRSGTGGVLQTTDEAALQTTTNYELLSLGKVNIPAGNYKLTDLGDQFDIAIQAKNSSGAARSVYLFDLILIPTDEWCGDFVDKANTTTSIIGTLSGVERLLDIDSVTYPKRGMRSLVRNVNAFDSIAAAYQTVTVGDAILQAQADQRLYILAARTSATGTSFSWIAEPWMTHSLQITMNERYYGARGDR